MAGLIALIDNRRNSVIFTGNTYPFRDQLKSLGARWNGEAKTWTVTSVLSVEKITSMFPGVQIEQSAVAEAVVTESVLSITVEQLPNAPLESSLSVGELVSKIRAILASAFSGTCLVHGVIGKARAQGTRMFLDLADPDDPSVCVSCVIWDRVDTVLKPLVDAGFTLEPDLPVMFEARVGLNAKGGQLSLAVSRIVPEYTTGKLLAQRELTNRRLREEGLFERNKQLTLPLLPRRLGILTSSGGTVINDFMASLEEGKFGFQLFWLPVSVQGAQAKREILAGLEQLAHVPALDAILLFRGGGSPAELALFNDYAIARAICCSPLPVISAIGHQADHSSAQDVSFLALGVPKDVGRYFASLVIEIRSRLQRAGDQTIRRSNQIWSEREARLSKSSHLLSSRALAIVRRREDAIQREIRSIPRHAVQKINSARVTLSSVGAPIPALARSQVQHRNTSISQNLRHVEQQSRRHRKLAARAVASLGQKIHAEAALKVATRSQALLASSRRVREHYEATSNRAQQQLRSVESLVDAVKPEAQLRRGFALIHRQSLEVTGPEYIKRQSELAPTDKITIEFVDGRINATVEK